MANWDILKRAISDAIKTNDNQEITGQLLQQTLLSIVTNVGANATFAGIATPATNPGTPDGPVFYIASQQGTYANFNNFTVSDKVCIFKWLNNTWLLENTNIPNDSDDTIKKQLYELNYLKADIVLGTNLFNPKNFILGEWVTDSGIDSVGYGIGRTPFIPIDEHSDITIKTSGDLYQCRGALFSADMSIIPGSITEPGEMGQHIQTIHWSEGAKYVVFSLREDPVINGKRVMVYYGDDADKPYEPYTQHNDVDDTIKNVAPTWTTVDNINIIKGTFIKHDGGDSIGEGRACSDYIPLVPKSKIRVTGAEFGNIYVAGIAFYNQDRTCIKTVQSNDGDSYECIIEDGCFYMRISTFVDTPVDVKVNYQETILSGLQSVYMPAEYNLENYDVKDYMAFCKTYENQIFDGAKLVPSEQYSTSSMCPVIHGKEIAVTATYTSYARFYDGDKKFISEVICHRSKNVTANEIPSNAKYIAFQWDNNIHGEMGFHASIVGLPLGGDAYNSVIKKKGSRPKIYIYTSDSQISILYKMVTAYITQDCDVIFEHGEYIFDSVYEYMRDNLSWGWTMELPIGGNCNYFFNGATLKSYSPSDTFTDSRNILGTKATATSFKMFNCKLLNYGGTYCVHDEGSGGSEYCLHEYHEIEMHYISQGASSYIRKCIGGGASQSCEVLIENCYFNSDFDGSVDVSWHGSNDNKPTGLTLRIINSYLTRGISFDGEPDNNGRIMITGCRYNILQYADTWNVVEFGNTIVSA